MIYNKEPIAALWDIFKSLRKQIPIYKETMDEDADSTPESYLLLRAVTDTPFYFGDGVTALRVADCDAILVTKGTAQSTTDLHSLNRSKVKAVLDGVPVAYSGFNLGYDGSIKSTQYTWSVRIFYNQ